VRCTGRLWYKTSGSLRGAGLGPRAVPSETTQERDFSRRSNVWADSYLCPGTWGIIPESIVCSPRRSNTWLSFVEGVCLRGHPSLSAAKPDLSGSQVIGTNCKAR
jgi:hypothetical protein